MGSDHAEIQAIKDAAAKGHDVKGATVYVTLEPCSHYGRTPPCALRLIKEQVARVVVACLDPNPLVAGRGVEMLRQAGITVDVGLLQKSLDGFTALTNGESQWITGPEAREDGRRYRCEAGAILTGVGTVLADNPSLTARVDGKLQSRQPLKVLVDSYLRVNPENTFFDEGQTLVVCVEENLEKSQRLREKGAEILSLSGENGRVDLQALLKELARREVNEVHVEAGATLTGEMVRLGLVDELLCYSRSAFDLPPLQSLSGCETWTTIQTSQVGEDVRIILRKRK